MLVSDKMPCRLVLTIDVLILVLVDVGLGPAAWNDKLHMEEMS